MSRFVVLLVSLVLATDAGADAQSDHTSIQIVIHEPRPASSGYRAEVEVSSGGVSRYGLIIVTPDGCVHWEQLDEQTVRWVQGILHRGTPTSRGWYDRPHRVGPARIVRGLLGENEVLAEIHTPETSIKVSQHQILTAR
jgi:hypothetical protein